MTDEREEALRLSAEDWIEMWCEKLDVKLTVPQHAALRNELVDRLARAQPQREPVAEVTHSSMTSGRMNEIVIRALTRLPVGMKLYTSPPAQAVPEGYEYADSNGMAVTSEWVHGWNSCRELLSAASKPEGIANICPDGTAAPSGSRET